MDPSENKKTNDDAESKPLPDITNNVDNRQSDRDSEKTKEDLTVNTSDIEQHSSKIPPASARSLTGTPMTSASRQRSRRVEIPTDTRPDRTTRPEDLRRAQYLGTFNIEDENDPQQLPKKKKRKKWTCWRIWSRALTCWAFPFMMNKCGVRGKNPQQAWREKVALCLIILGLCGIVGFLTFGFNFTICGVQPNRIRPTSLEYNHIVIHGRAFDIKKFRHPTPVANMPGSGDLQELGVGGRDLSFMFQLVNFHCKGILKPIQPDDDKDNVVNYFPCVTLDRFNPKVNATDNPEKVGCHLSNKSRLTLKNLPLVGDVYYNWTDLQQPGTSLVAFNGHVLDLSRLRYLTPNIPLPIQVAQIVGPGSAFIGRDASYWLSTTADRLQIGQCLDDILRVGVLDTRSTGCIISDIVLWVSLGVILGVVLIRFIMALFFGWFLAGKIGSIREETEEERKKRLEKVLEWEMNNAEEMHYPRTDSIVTMPVTDHLGQPVAGSSVPTPINTTDIRPSFATDEPPYSAVFSPQAMSQKTKRRFFPTTSRFTQPNSPRALANSMRNFPTLMDGYQSSMASPTGYTISSQFFSSAQNHHLNKAVIDANSQAKTRYNFNFDLIHTFMVVTCYSEGEEGLRITLDSLANTDYPTTHKMLLVICDGIITGSGNEHSTPDIVLSMMKDDLIPRDQVRPCSYVAIADGTKRHNMAKVYAGYYSYNQDPSKLPEPIPEDQQQQVPMVVIVKCGTEAEAVDRKPGNRGKRDSQVILMNTMQKVYYGERMCELEYQFCKSIVKLTGYHPSIFETCLMVDADTKVYPDSLARMIACMSRDPKIMGLCGETKIANKGDTWVTAIQVFEYYISHHMSKAFESVFGGVTCLPGCFCMYRIIAPKGDRFVPIFCASDIVEMYCENVVDTLHKKNLLLLGEDRYLTTLMLRTFPKRKMVFVPQAVCKTVVPDKFRILLSQRRRWINSTVHNLLELVLIRDLCGAFCFSMQFVVFMELVGTVVLPAAICFTMYLVIISFIVSPVPYVPLFLLAAILGLPAVLIAFTTRKVVYIFWMTVYLISLPIWNFVLPAYAYWHFDDFSWGQTRVVEGASKEEDHGAREGEFDSTGIVMKRFEEWAKQERKQIAEERMAASTVVRSFPKIYYGH